MLNSVQVMNNPPIWKILFMRFFPNQHMFKDIPMIPWGTRVFTRLNHYITLMVRCSTAFPPMMPFPTGHLFLAVQFTTSRTRVNRYLANWARLLSFCPSLSLCNFSLIVPHHNYIIAHQREGYNLIGGVYIRCT